MKYRLLEKTKVYSAPNLTAPVLIELQPDDEIKIGEVFAIETGRWHTVALLDGKAAYISAKTKGSRVWGPLDICYAVCAGAFIWVPASFFAFYYVVAKMNLYETIGGRFFFDHLIANAVILFVCAIGAALSGRKWSWVFVILNCLLITPAMWYWFLAYSYSGGIYK